MGDFPGAWHQFSRHACMTTAPRSRQDTENLGRYNMHSVVRESRNSNPTTKTTGSGYTTPSRFHAARYALKYLWKFVQVQGLVSGVNTRKYPYQLVRVGQLPFSEIMQQQTTFINSMGYFLNSFDDDYIRAAVQKLCEVTVAGSLIVSASFGQTPFPFNYLAASREYRWSELREIRYPSDIQSTWANFCDDEAPTLRSLIAALNEAAPSQNSSKMKIAAHCCREGDPQNVKLVFVRQHDGWAYVASVADKTS